MSELKIFKNPDFGQVRVIEKEGEPWFAGKDITAILGYENQNRDIVSHVAEEDRIMLTAETQYENGIEFDYRNLGQRGGWLINESGLYSLILSSKLPAAKQFKHWITSEVLPSIRKHGGYIAGQEAMSDDDLLAKALLVAQSKISEKDKQIDRMRPKEIFADAVTASKSSILIGELAKLLNQNGVDTGQKRLFAWMRENGYLIKGKNRSDYGMPTQRAMDLGLFEIKETTINHSDGRISLSKTVKVTGKGQQYFVNKFLAG